MVVNDFSNYLFRCSGLGNIVTPSNKLTQGAESYINQCFIEKVYGIKKDITSKYFEKGIICEPDGMKVIRRIYPHVGWIEKNTTRFSNKWIDGEPDALALNEGFEIKNAYDMFTFANASLTHLYLWQIKGYLWLTGKKKFTLVYVLSDMPDSLIGNEEKKLWYSGNFTDTEDERWIEAQMMLHQKYNYSSIHEAERFKTWEVILDDLDVKKITDAVERSRAYMESLEVERIQHIKNNLQLLNGRK